MQMRTQTDVTTMRHTSQPYSPIFPLSKPKKQSIFVTGHMISTVKTIPSPVSFIFQLLGTVGWGEVLGKIHDQISQMPRSRSLNVTENRIHGSAPEYMEKPPGSYFFIKMGKIMLHFVKQETDLICCHINVAWC